MSMDYEELANKDNPFDALSPAETDRLIIYFTYVRDPVLTQKEIQAKWGVRMSDKDIPLFEATRIADQIRYEIKKRSESVQKSRNKLIALGCAMVLFLLIIEAFRIPRQSMIDKSTQTAKLAQYEVAKCQDELGTTKDTCRKRIEQIELTEKENVARAKENCDAKVAQAELAAKEKVNEIIRIANERVSKTEQKEKEKYGKLLSDYISAGLSGDARSALSKIKEAVQVCSENPDYQVESDLATLLDRAQGCLKDNSSPSESLFQCGQRLKDYLLRHQAIDAAKRLDITDMMLNCFKKSLESGTGKSGVELFLLYDGKKHCLLEADNRQEMKMESKLIVADNQLLAWTALEKTCSLGSYDALSVMLFLAESNNNRHNYGYRRRGIFFRYPAWNNNNFGNYILDFCHCTKSYFISTSFACSCVINSKIS